MNLEKSFDEKKKDVASTHPAPDATGIEWRAVPAGPFWMGSAENDSEKPKHRVECAAFMISRFPITNAQYVTFVQDEGYERQAYWTPAGWAWRQKEKINVPHQCDDDFDRLDHPAIEVSWYEAVAFTRWLSQRSGQPVRLPSEAEWEKAARGENGRIYPWGDQWEQDRANTSEAKIGATSAVGRFSPAGDSPYGVADMAGNIWEWCQSLYRPYPYQADDREGLDGTGRRALRGGSWDNSQDSARCASRDFSPPDHRGYYLGFRVVCAPGGS